MVWAVCSIVYDRRLNRVSKSSPELACIYKFISVEYMQMSHKKFRLQGFPGGFERLVLLLDCGRLDFDSLLTGDPIEKLSEGRLGLAGDFDI
jgi:hypothetical protein